MDPAWDSQFLNILPQMASSQLVLRCICGMLFNALSWLLDTDIQLVSVFFHIWNFLMLSVLHELQAINYVL